MSINFCQSAERHKIKYNHNSEMLDDGLPEKPQAHQRWSPKINLWSAD